MHNKWVCLSDNDDLCTYAGNLIEINLSVLYKKHKCNTYIKLS